jgi:pantoate--beta-alanine ligase
VEPESGHRVAALLAAWRARQVARRGAPERLEGIAALRRWRAAAAGSVGFVPTMGALHEGHRALMRVARQECDQVVVSVYVNPLQFGPREDFAAYPRTLEADAAACAAEQVDALAVFRDAEMYPPGHETRVIPGPVASGGEGRHRPGHFAGVTTVVAKLFNLVQPHRAYFGQKDAQQCAVIRRMVRDLDWPLTVEVLPTVRAPDGLALSSRNAYLSAAERTTALHLSAALRATAAAAADGERDAARLRAGLEAALTGVAGLQLDYAELVDPECFTPVTRIEHVAIAAVAARVGTTRLIDNVPCWPPPTPA